MVVLFKKVVKLILPVFFYKKINHLLNNFIYFHGLYRAKPKVYSIELKGKRLFLSNSIDITHWDKLDIGDNVFIWHFTILDTFNGIKIGNDCQIGTRVGMFTHSSHNSIRYYNESYYDVYFDCHKGRVKGSIEIGDNTFVGANAIIMPGTKIGRGSIVAAFSYVQGEFPDFAIIAGNPAKVVGDVRRSDYRFLKNNDDLCQSYLDYYSFDKIDALRENAEKKN